MIVNRLTSARTFCTRFQTATIRSGNVRPAAGTSRFPSNASKTVLFEFATTLRIQTFGVEAGEAMDESRYFVNQFSNHFFFAFNKNVISLYAVYIVK